MLLCFVNKRHGKGKQDTDTEREAVLRRKSNKCFESLKAEGETETVKKHCGQSSGE